MSLFDNEIFTMYRDADLEAFYDVDKKNRRKIISAHAIIHFLPVLFACLITQIYSYNIFSRWLVVFSLLLYAIAIIETAAYLFPTSRVYYKKYFLWFIIPAGFLIGIGGYFAGTDLLEYAGSQEIDAGTAILRIFAGLAGIFLLFVISQFGLNQILRASKSLYTRKAKVEADIQFATEIQERILKEVEIDRPDVRAYACSNPANELGGDFFELSQRDDHLFASIGDISGHSFGAGLVMTLTKSALQTHLGYNHNPAKVMAALNVMLNRQTDRAMYATMTLLKLNIPERNVTLCNAGHLPVFQVLGKKGEIIHRYEKGIGLGLTGMASYKNLGFQAEKDDLLILYSDGLIETRDENRQVRDADFFEGLITETIRSGFNSPRELASDLLRKVRESDYSLKMEDDTTLVVIEV